jgi:2-iminobutanoate/2-iminopropanoate deaminase
MVECPERRAEPVEVCSSKGVPRPQFKAFLTIVGLGTAERFAHRLLEQRLYEGDNMPKQQITTRSGASPVGAYSQGLRVGDFIFVSGQGPLDPATGQVVGETIEEQTARVLENIKAILAAGGATIADVVKVSAHLSDLELFDRYNKVYATYFPDPKPTRTTVGSQLKGILVEIDAIAYIGEK